MPGNLSNLAGAKYFKLDEDEDDSDRDDDDMSDLAATEDYCDAGSTSAEATVVVDTPNHDSRQLGALLAITDGEPPTGRERGAQQSDDGANRRSRSIGALQRG